MDKITLRHAWFRAPALLLVPLFALLGLVACGDGTTAAPASTTSARHDVVILATASHNEPQPSLTERARALLTTAAGTADGAALVLGPGGTGRSYPLTPMRNGQVENGPRRDRLIQAAVAGVEDALASAPALREQEVELLEPLNAVHRLAPTPGTLVVVSSGVTTTGALDLRRLGWAADPDEVADELSARRVLPDLTGWVVLFEGLGDVGGDQPPLSEPARRALVDYWTTICRRAHAVRCDVDNSARAILPSRSTGAVSPVAVDPVTSLSGPERDTTYSLPSQLLFGRDSAALAPGADVVLQPIVGTATDGFVVAVTGHTDAGTGSPAHNLDLSSRRAQAVADRLLTLGLPTSRLGPVRGEGSAGTTAAAEQTDGIPDAHKASVQRFVRIQVTPFTGTHS